MEREQAVAEALAASVTRIDAILVPWGFTFQSEGVHLAHGGWYAAGCYCRETTQIGISCRDTIDNIYYSHRFVTVRPFSREIETFTLGHRGITKAMGHAEDCCLIEGGKFPDRILARDGGDRVNALIHDLQSILAPVLGRPCEEFYAIMRSGIRGWQVE